MRRATWAAALLALACACRLAAAASPCAAPGKEVDPPFWHFAVVASNFGFVSIVFPKVPNVPAQAYAVQRSADGKGGWAPAPLLDLGAGPLTDLGALLLGVELLAAPPGRRLAQAPALPFYRVAILDAAGAPAAVSPPLQPVLNVDPATGAPNVLVVDGGGAVPSAPDCGDLIPAPGQFAPCFSIGAAVASARAASGSRVYVTPGVYVGPENANVATGAKALRFESTNGMDLTCWAPVERGSYAYSLGRALTIEAGGRNTSGVAGFTISRGMAVEGGCLRVAGADPTLADLRLFNCTATSAPPYGDGRVPGQGGALSIGPAVPLAEPVAARRRLQAPAPAPPGAALRRVQFIFNVASMGGALAAVGARLDIQGGYFLYSIAASATGFGGAMYVTDGSVVTGADFAMTSGYAGFSGGALTLQTGSRMRLDRVAAVNNTAGNFGGAFMLFGADLTVSDSNVTANTANLFGGAVLMTSSSYTALRTLHDRNAAQFGGAAVKVLSSNATLDGCAVTNSRAQYGGGVDVAKQAGGGGAPTYLLVRDTVIEGNVVSDRGAGLFIDSADGVLLERVRVAGNKATRGGGLWCESSTPVDVKSCSFELNSAQEGGAVFADAPCRLRAAATVFSGNTAGEYGAAVAAGDGTVLDFKGCQFLGNGVSECPATQPPVGGGALMVGVQQFTAGDECGAFELVPPAEVTAADCAFEGNAAVDRGGAVLVERGSLRLSRCRLAGNAVTGAGIYAGVGGGLALVERCLQGACTEASAALDACALTNNTAVAAGGGLHYEAAPGSGGSLALEGCELAGNAVATGGDPADAASIDGVGGGAYISGRAFSLAESRLEGNAAAYGGGLFISADLADAAAARLSRLVLADNAAARGAAVYWLRAASPGAELDASTLLVTPLAEGAVSTEVRGIRYAAERAAPAAAQSGRAAPPFGVALVDFYGAPAPTERYGTCEVVPPAAGATLSAAGAPLPAPVVVGGRQGVDAGAAEFADLRVTGVIGEAYALQVGCALDARGAAAPYLARLPGGAAAGAAALEPLAWPLAIADCVPGFQPDTERLACNECTAGNFNLDGEACLPCPAEGATCPGGDRLEAREGWWRSGPASAQFFTCGTPGVCLAGAAAGDAACAEGHVGPLCGVCEDDFFLFAGTCRSCEAGGLAKAMLAVFVVLIVAMVAAIFARSWEFGTPGTPGVMTKVKILLAHFQMLALFRDYDVSWPRATQDSMGWFEVLNFGVAMLAPSCFVGSEYSFYWRWCFQMALPLGAVALCAALWAAARAALRALDADGARRAAPKPGGAVGWLAGLEVRCWKNGFWLVTLLYPRCAMTALQLFATERLDTGTFLSADLSILVRPPGGSLSRTYVKYLPPGVLMLLVFAAVIPGFWFLAIWRNRGRLDDPAVAARYGFLYGSYTRRFAYWETTEMLRKFVVALVPVFVRRQAVGSLQGAVGQIVVAAYAGATLALRPFAAAEDNYLQVASLGVQWLVLLSAGAAKWAHVTPGGERGLAGAQLLLSSGVAFAALVLAGLGARALLARRRAGAAGGGGGGGGKPAATAAARPPKKAAPQAQQGLPIRVRASDSVEGGAGRLGGSAGLPGRGGGAGAAPPPAPVAPPPPPVGRVAERGTQTTGGTAV